MTDRLSGAAVPMAQILWRPGGSRGGGGGSGRSRCVRALPAPSVAGRAPGWIEVRSLGHRPADSLSLDEAEAASWQLVHGSRSARARIRDGHGRGAGPSAARRSRCPIAQVTAEDIRKVSAPNVESLLSQMPGLQSQAGPAYGIEHHDPGDRGLPCARADRRAAGERCTARESGPLAGSPSRASSAWRS